MSEQPQGWFHHCHHEPDHDPAACVAGQLADIRAQLGRIEKNTEHIMSEDSAIQAVTADLVADEQAITASLTTIQAAVTAALADAVQPSTVSALQAAQAALDSLTATAASDATADAPPAAS
jgi:hypothetical protein